MAATLVNKAISVIGYDYSEAAREQSIKTMVIQCRSQPTFLDLAETVFCDYFIFT